MLNYRQNNPRKENDISVFDELSTQGQIKSLGYCSYVRLTHSFLALSPWTRYLHAEDDLVPPSSLLSKPVEPDQITECSLNCSALEVLRVSDLGGGTKITNSPQSVTIRTVPGINLVPHHLMELEG
jgi:hypothetical protein